MTVSEINTFVEHRFKNQLQLEAFNAYYTAQFTAAAQSGQGLPPFQTIMADIMGGSSGSDENLPVTEEGRLIATAKKQAAIDAELNRREEERRRDSTGEPLPEIPLPPPPPQHEAPSPISGWDAVDGKTEERGDLFAIAKAKRMQEEEIE